jgi:hypothetical protein
MMADALAERGTDEAPGVAVPLHVVSCVIA